MQYTDMHALATTIHNDRIAAETAYRRTMAASDTPWGHRIEQGVHAIQTGVTLLFTTILRSLSS